MLMFIELKVKGNAPVQVGSLFFELSSSGAKGFLGEPLTIGGVIMTDLGSHLDRGGVGLMNALNSTTILYGDIDGDGWINSADVTMMRRYVAENDKAAFLNSNPTFCVIRADVCGHGEPFDAGCVTMLRRYVASSSNWIVPEFVVSPTSLLRTASAFNTTVGITTNITWTATVIQDGNWLTATPGSNGITLQAAANQNTNERVATVAVKVIPFIGRPVKTVDIKVTQQGAPVVPVTITWSSPNATPATFTTPNLIPGSQIGSALRPAPTRSGHTFIGWYNSNGQQITGSSVVPNANATYTARWITWNANGGTVSSVPLSLTPNNQFGVLPTPTRPGHTFDGWFDTSVAFGGTRLLSTHTVLSVNTTYWARWIANPITITWNANGGTPSSTTTHTGTTIGALPTPPTRAGGFTFAGWFNTDSAVGGTQITGNSTVPGSNTTYWARWSFPGTLGVLSHWNSDQQGRIYRWPANAHPATVHARSLSPRSGFEFFSSLHFGIGQWNSALGRSINPNTVVFTVHTDAMPIVFWGGTEAHLVSTGVPVAWATAGGVFYDAQDDIGNYPAATHALGSHSFFEGHWRLGNQNVAGMQLVRVRGYIVDADLTLGQQRRLSTHELGHALGWHGHSLNSSDIMSSELSNFATLTSNDIDHLRQIYP
jgi:uncharacterized repeat protein (TIGR02543 family)